MVGATVSYYKIVKRLGRGGMRVYDGSGAFVAECSEARVEALGDVVGSK